MRRTLKATGAATYMLITTAVGVVDYLDKDKTYLPYFLVGSVGVAFVVLAYFFAPWVKDWVIDQVDRNPFGPKFRFRPAHESDLPEIAALQRRVYSPSDAVPLDVLQEWFLVSPGGFFVLEDKQGSIVGHIDVLPIKPAALKLYKEGKIIETEIRGECLYSPSERDLIEDVYVESVIARPKLRTHRSAATRVILLSLDRIVGGIADVQKVRRLSAMAATVAGEQFSQRIGLKVISMPKDRRDGHKMLEGDFQEIRQKVQAALSPFLPE